jgi:hypothetical protein
MNKDENQKPMNKLCSKCVRSCKQSDQMLMLDCPRFQQRPFKSDTHRYQQLDLFNEKKR